MEEEGEMKVVWKVSAAMPKLLLPSSVVTVGGLIIIKYMII